MLTTTHLTQLSAICDRLSGELALPSRVCCDVFRRKLIDWGCHVGTEHLGRRNSFTCAGTPARNLGSQVSNFTHGASVTFIDGFLNPDGEDTWRDLLDPISKHRATETRAQIPEHTKFAYIAAGPTSYAQPLDRAIFGTCKHVVSKHGQSSTGCFAVGHGWSVELLRGLWSAAPEGSMGDEDTGCARGGVCVCART